MAADPHEAARSADAPAVSVICTARDAADTIGKTIASIVAQDFQNWEMIIVDDGSRDDTLRVARALAATDRRIRVVATGGIGRGRALNRALAEARADLVSNIDADDEVHPRLLSCQLEARRRHPELSVISTDWFRIYGAARPGWRALDDNASYEIRDITRELAFANPIYHSSVMMPKATILGLGGYDEQRDAKFDYDLWVRCAAAGLRLGRIRLPLVAQRIHSGQAYMHGRKLRNLIASLRVQRRAMRTLGGHRRYLPMILVRFGWGVLPLSLRLGLRDLWGSRSQG